MTNSIGNRIAHIRASTSQRQFAEDLAVPLRTFQNYEQDRREPDQRTLVALYERGWNLNWVLIGEGPERLEALPPGAFASPDSTSQDLIPGRLTLALEAVQGALQGAGKWLPPAKQAEAVMLVYELLGTGLPEAEVIPLAQRAVRLGHEQERESDATGGERAASRR